MFDTWDKFPSHFNTLPGTLIFLCHDQLVPDITLVFTPSDFYLPQKEKFFQKEITQFLHQSSCSSCKTPSPYHIVYRQSAVYAVAYTVL